MWYSTTPWETTLAGGVQHVRGSVRANVSRVVCGPASVGPVHGVGGGGHRPDPPWGRGSPNP